MERALLLKTLGHRELSVAEIAVLVEHARERRFRAGETILRSGERVPAFHVLVEGRVRAEGGEYLDGRELGPREDLGLLSLLARREKGVDATTLEDTVTLSFDEEVFFDILEDHFPLTHGLVRYLAHSTLELRRLVPPGTYLAPLEGVLRPPDRPLDLVERILLIRRPGSPFEHSGLDAVTQVARQTPEVHFEKGVTIWKSGDRSDHALILVSGTIACTTQWGISRFRVGPGYPLGNLERFSGDPRWYTATTETPVVAVRTDTEPFLDVVEDHFDMALDLLAGMAKRVIGIRREMAGAAEAAGAGARPSG